MARIVTWEGGNRVIREAHADELPPAPTWEELQVQAGQVVQRHLDATARSLRYDSALSLLSYHGSTNGLRKAQAVAFSKWRDDVWAQVDAYTPETAPADGAALIADLPEFTAPTGGPR